MGKFKELAIEYKDAQVKNDLAEKLCQQYPFLQYFIRQAFDEGDEDKVFALIFALETDNPTC